MDTREVHAAIGALHAKLALEKVTPDEGARILPLIHALADVANFLGAAIANEDSELAEKLAALQYGAAVTETSAIEVPVALASPVEDDGFDLGVGGVTAGGQLPEPAKEEPVVVTSEPASSPLVDEEVKQ